jgi:hypothetical protein
MNKSIEELNEYVESLPPFSLEPKTRNRWFVRFPEEFNIQQWTISDVERPSIILDKETNLYHWNPISISFFDTTINSNTKTLIETIQKTHDISHLFVDSEIKYDEKWKDGFSLFIEMLDPHGIVVDRLELVGSKITFVDFDDLDINDQSPLKLSILVEYTAVKLHNIQITTHSN